MPEMVKYDVEVTDTFGGEANYCWVHRHVIEVPRGSKRATIVRAAKAAEGWTGMRCETSDLGELIDVRPQGAAMVMFISYKDEKHL